MGFEEEAKYKQSMDNLSGEVCSGEHINYFLKSKANLLIATINKVNLPKSEARCVIVGYANKLIRVGNELIGDGDLDSGDTAFLLDQLHSVKRNLDKRGKKLTTGLEKFILQLNRSLTGKKYIAKGESCKSR